MSSAMRYPDSRDTQGLWRNRRVQRSAFCALLFLVFIALGLYFRTDLSDLRFEAVADSRIHNTPYQSDKFVPPPSYEPSEEPVNEPIKPPVKHKPTKTAAKSGKPAKPAKTSAAKVATAEETKDSEFDLDRMPEIPKPKGETPKAGNKIDLDTSRIALLIETRPLPLLPALLSSFIATVPYKWGVKVAGTKEVFALIRSSAALAAHVSSGKLGLMTLPSQYPVDDQEAISGTLTNLKFYSEFLKPADWVLMFQTDSIICSASDQSLDDWVAKNYSWVGAPWFPDMKGGNGGLSLRHIPSIISVLQNETRKPGDEQFEDLWLSSRLENAAMGNVEMAFSVESQYYERPLGYHLRGSGKLVDPDIWGNMTRKRQILNYCPEVKILLGNMALETGDDEQLRLQEVEADKKKAEEDANSAKEVPKTEKEDKSKESKGSIDDLKDTKAAKEVPKTEKEDKSKESKGSVGDVKDVTAAKEVPKVEKEDKSKESKTVVHDLEDDESSAKPHATASSATLAKSKTMMRSKTLAKSKTATRSKTLAKSKTAAAS